MHWVLLILHRDLQPRLLHELLLLTHGSHLRVLIRHLLELGGLFQALPELHLLLVVWRWHHLRLLLLLYIGRGSQTSTDPHLRLLLLLLPIEINLGLLLHLLGLLDQRILGLHRDLHRLPPHQILLGNQGGLKLLLWGLLWHRIQFVHWRLLE